MEIFQDYVILQKNMKRQLFIFDLNFWIFWIFWFFSKFFEFFWIFIFFDIFLKFWIIKFWKLMLKLVRLLFCMFERSLMDMTITFSCTMSINALCWHFYNKNCSDWMAQLSKYPCHHKVLGSNSSEEEKTKILELWNYLLQTNSWFETVTKQ